jgi:hypothetical protein
MPQVHYKKARKNYRDAGIKKGDMYYSWSFRYGGKRMSKTAPRPSQLTQSKMSGALAAGEGLEDAIAAATCPQDLLDALDQAASEVTEVKEEYEESLNNMITQEGTIAEEMQEKIDGLEEWASALEGDKQEVEGIDGVDEFDTLSDERKEEVMEEARTAAGENTSCPF